MDKEKNLYEILNCDEKSTFEDLRKSYHRLLKAHHPDKDKNTSSEHFLNIQKAWETLSNDDKRKQYDAELLETKLNKNTLIFSTLTLSEMKFNSDENEYSYFCRCGGIYQISKEEIMADTIVNCNECSLAIIIQF